MINIPTKNDLVRLRSIEAPHCLTIYLPFDDIGSDSSGHRIQIKNLLRETEIALLSSGVDAEHVATTLNPLRALLLENRTVWWLRQASLALFVKGKFLRYYYIPDQNIPYQLTIAQRFYLEPLVRILAQDRQYYVLALSHNNVHLYQGGRYRLRLMQLRRLPTNLKGSLRIDEYPQSRQTHQVAPVYVGKGSEGYHSQYNVAQVDKKMLMEFFRSIDKSLHQFLQTNRQPLILAGVDYLMSIYRRVNTYPGLVQQGIRGDFKLSQSLALRDQAWKLIEENAS